MRKNIFTKLLPVIILNLSLSLNGCGIAGLLIRQPEKQTESSETEIRASEAEQTISETEQSIAETDTMTSEEETEAPETVAAESGKIELLYDDRFSFDEEIVSIETVNVISKTINTDIDDQAVLCQAEDSKYKVIASGCGDAIVNLTNGNAVAVHVSAAPISLIMITGQSNGEGRPSSVKKLDTYKKQWVVNEEGTAYSTYAPSDEYNQDMYKEIAWYEDEEGIGELSVDTADRFIPNSLADNTQNDIYNRTDRLTDQSENGGKSGLDGAFCYKWHMLTGEKVWLINAAHHGSNIKSWNPEDNSDNNYDESLALYKAAEELLEQEIEAGHYTLSKKGIIWCQGENNRTMDSSDYFGRLETIFDHFNEDLAGSEYKNMNAPLDFAGILMVRTAAQDPSSVDDFILNGARKAQYFITQSKTHENVFLASHVSELWDTDVHVKDYFMNQYGSEKAYQKEHPMIMENPEMPDSVEDVHSSIHYTQLAYNEIGMDAAENLYYELGYEDCPADTPRVAIVSADGLTDISGQTVNYDKEGAYPFVVKVWPAYLSKDIAITTTDNAEYVMKGIRRLGDGPVEVNVSVDGVTSQVIIDTNGESE